MPLAARSADFAARSFARPTSAVGVRGATGDGVADDGDAEEEPASTASLTFFFASALSTSSSTLSFFAIVDFLYFREREDFAFGEPGLPPEERERADGDIPEDFPETPAVLLRRPVDEPRDPAVARRRVFFFSSGNTSPIASICR